MTRSNNIQKSDEMRGPVPNTDYIRSGNTNPSVLNAGDDQESKRSEESQQPDTKGVSKRSLRLAAIDGEVGSDGKAKGKVRVTALQGLEYWSEDKKDAAKSAWVPAVYHNDLRDFLIEEWNRWETYDHPRAHGSLPTDITCYHPDQKSWGGSREHRPKVLFQIFFDEKDLPPAENSTVEEGFRPKPRATTAKAEKAPFWYQDNRIVLDGDNHPVKQYGEIPAVCSSEMEGWLMVAIRRLNPSITTQDFRARMPHFRALTANGEGEKRQWSLQAHSMRQTRFQFKAGCLALEARAGSDTIKKYLMELLPAECKARNSTEGFRDLTDAEVDAMKAANKGGFSYRGKRKVNAGEEPTNKRIKCTDKTHHQQTDNVKQDELSSEHEESRFGQPEPHGGYDTGNTLAQNPDDKAFQDIHAGVVGYDLRLFPSKEDTESTKEQRTTKRKRIYEDDSGDIDKEHPLKALKRVRYTSPIATTEAYPRNDNRRTFQPLGGQENGTALITKDPLARDDWETNKEEAPEEFQPQVSPYEHPTSGPIPVGDENEDGSATQESTEPPADFLTALYFNLQQEETQVLETPAGNELELIEENAIDPSLVDPALSLQETSTERRLPQQMEPEVSPNPVASVIAEEQAETPSSAIEPSGFSLDFLEQPNGYFDLPLPEVGFFDAEYGSIYGAFVQDD